MILFHFWKRRTACRSWKDRHTFNQNDWGYCLFRDSSLINWFATSNFRDRPFFIHTELYYTSVGAYSQKILRLRLNFVNTVMHNFVLLQSYISKWSKLSISACNKTSILTWGLVAFSWVYRRNEILIVVVRSFVNRYPGSQREIFATMRFSRTSRNFLARK
jgi:hypothetical protein